MSEATIVALYDHYDNASAAVTEIIQTGVGREKISLLANNLNGDHPPLLTNPSYAREEIDTKEDAQPGVVTGAEFGIGVGGIFGLLIGTGAIVVPGIGPLIAAGTWAAVGAGAAAGGVIGGAIGLLTNHGISDKDAHLYAEGLKRGGTLVTVVADEHQIDAISHIFKTHGAVDIEKRGATWSAEGWVGFDPYLEHLTPEELAATRNGHWRDTVEHHHAVRHYFKPGDGTAEVPDGATNIATHYGEDQLKL
jgi:hypothetical protein